VLRRIIMANYGLKYSGKAIIKVIKGNKVIKTIKKSNKGTESLFRAICNSLIGNPTSGMPNYIGAFAKHGGTSALKTKIVISSKTSNGTSANFETTFPSNALVKGNGGNTTIECLRMYTSETSADNDYLAEIDFGEGNGIDIGNNESLIVRWVMTIGNVEEKQNG
jgi:hypothetical protein